MNAGSNWQWKTQTQTKVQIMEACRNYFHNGTLIVKSMDAIEEMRTIVRNGDEIGAEAHNRDDRVFSLALGVRFWEDRFRRTLIAGNRTREAERARLSLSPVDRALLYQRNMLQDFFKTKQSSRLERQWAAQRASWRSGVGIGGIARNGQRRWR
jgi:hypothetical protein